MGCRCCLAVAGLRSQRRLPGPLWQHPDEGASGSCAIVPQRGVAGENSVLATIGAADSGWRRWRMAGLQERSINPSGEFHHYIDHVLLQKVAGRQFRLPQQVCVWR